MQATATLQEMVIFQAPFLVSYKQALSLQGDQMTHVDYVQGVSSEYQGRVGVAFSHSDTTIHHTK